MKLSLRKDLQINTVRSEADWNKFRIHTLLQNSKRNQAAISSYICSRFSSSSDSITQIGSEVVNSRMVSEEGERMRYLDGMLANVSLCFEYIPNYSIMKNYYMFPRLNILDMEDRRYVLNDKNFVKIPKDLCNDNNTRKEYERIILKQLEDYRELKPLTREFLKKKFNVNESSKKEIREWKRRATEMSDYLLPLGLSTRGSLSGSVEDLIEIVRLFSASDSVVDNEIANMLIELLSHEESEVKLLIKSIDPDCSRKNSARKILKYFSEEVSRNQLKVLPQNELDNLTVDYLGDPTEELISHYESLLNPLGSSNELRFTDSMQKDIGEILFEVEDNLGNIGNIAQMGSIKISGTGAMYLVNKLNRISRLKKFIPLFHDEIDMEQELGRKKSLCFFLPRYLYLPEAKKLRRQYERRLIETYSRIGKWRKSAVQYMSKEVVDEYTKYLLPNAHATVFSVYGSVDDLQYMVNLKSTNDVSMDEKVFVHECMRLLSIKDPLWVALLRKIIRPDVENRNQFFNKE